MEKRTFLAVLLVDIMEALKNIRTHNIPASEIFLERINNKFSYGDARYTLVPAGEVYEVLEGLLSEDSEYAWNVSDKEYRENLLKECSDFRDISLFVALEG